MFLRICSRSRASYLATPVCRFRALSYPTVILNLENKEPAPELIAQLAQETYNTDLLLVLVQNISRFEFEARKDVVQIFNNLLRRQIGSRWPTVEYLSGKHDVIFAALAGYENEEVALNTGMILKEMLRHEQLCKILLCSNE
jgi:calcium binding protein 39